MDKYRFIRIRSTLSVEKMAKLVNDQLTTNEIVIGMAIDGGEIIVMVRELS